MKKLIVTLGILSSLFIANIAMADVFDTLEGLSPTQKEQLTQIYNTYKEQNNSIDTQIMQYTDKISQLKNVTNKTETELSLLKSNYETNVQSLKNQQQLLKIILLRMQ